MLFDGTFWSDDELIALGIGDRTAREMDHLPVSGPDGSLDASGRAAQPRKGLHPHQQHQPDAARGFAGARAVERRGLAVGSDGMRFTSDYRQP